MSVPFVDSRNTFPRNSEVKWPRRSVEDIRGFVVHQTLGQGSIRQAAKYHVSKENHISSGKGLPSLSYTFGIDRDGTIHFANDIEDRTASQGGLGRAPISGTTPNTNYLAIAVAGDFRAGDYQGSRAHPYSCQVASLIALIWHLSGFRRCVSIPEALFGVVSNASHFDVWGHYHFGKRFCPGDTLSCVVEMMRMDRPVCMVEKSARVWQLRLKLAGFDPGPVDDVWGPRSKNALCKYQTRMGLEVTGVRDAATFEALMVSD